MNSIYVNGYVVPRDLEMNFENFEPSAETLVDALDCSKESGQNYHDYNYNQKEEKQSRNRYSEDECQKIQELATNLINKQKIKDRKELVTRLHELHLSRSFTSLRCHSYQCKTSANCQEFFNGFSFMK